LLEGPIMEERTEVGSTGPRHVVSLSAQGRTVRCTVPRMVAQHRDGRTVPG
jgi:hypothetical protein